MSRFLIACNADSPTGRRVRGARLAAYAWIVPAMFVAGCGGNPQEQTAAMVDAQATLAREQAIRDGMNLELKKFEGEKTILLWRAAIVGGELKPPVLTEDKRSPLVRLRPSWGIGRVWRLWGRHPEAMPWYNQSVGSRMRTATEQRYAYLVNSVDQRMKAQDRRIEEAKKYLELITSASDGE
jgi:hypothetical protein